MDLFICDVILVFSPDSTKSPGSWPAHYIKHFSSPLPNSGKVDYSHLSHFHSDHISRKNCQSCVALKDDIGSVQKQVGNGAVAEQFEAGSRKQISLLHDSGKI